MMPILILVFIIGSVIGSFLNVCIYRIPRKESIVFPGSHCPKCNSKIKWYDNLPIISYIFFLRGKCRNCKEKISFEYPLVELLTGILLVVIFNKYLISYSFLKFAIFVTILIILSFVDLKEYILPDVLTISLIAFGFLFSIFNSIWNINLIYATSFESSFIGAAIFCFPFLLLYGFGESILKKEVMGFGDVKLAAGIGAFIGYIDLMQVYMFFMISFVLGSIISVFLIVLKIKSRKDIIPFGPYIALSGLIMILLERNGQ